jgi:hypothetical protein
LRRGLAVVALLAACAGASRPAAPVAAPEPAPVEPISNVHVEPQEDPAAALPPSPFAMNQPLSVVDPGQLISTPRLRDDAGVRELLLAAGVPEPELEVISRRSPRARGWSWSWCRRARTSTCPTASGPRSTST